MTVQSTRRRSDLDQSLRVLAQYRPFEDSGVAVEYVRRTLVLTAALESGQGGFGSLAECREALLGLWGLELDLDELREVTNRLVDAGELRRKGAGFCLTTRTQENLQTTSGAERAIERTALAEWESGLRAAGFCLDNGELAELREDLHAWLHRIITRFGIEAAYVLYPEQERAQRFFAELEELGYDFLPTRGAQLARLRPQALHQFIRQPTPAQRSYLANLMNTAYLMAVFTIDPAAHRLMQGVTKGQVVYLDTNVVYAALNLKGPRAYLTTKRVLEMTQGLGYELAITPWTLRELKHSLKRAKEQLRSLKLPPRELAELAADAADDETFVTAYWRRYRETGVAQKDFYEFYEQVEALLGRLGIAVVSTSCVAVERATQRVDEHICLIERVPGGAAKPVPVKEHDVRHRLLVERLRGDGHRRFSNARAWFLTNDRTLIPYSELEKDDEALPFAVSLTAWAQVVRSFTPRTQDYEQTLVDLLDTPSVRPATSISAQTVAEIVGRVDLLVEDSVEDVATRMLLDTALVAEIEQARGGDRQARIDAGVQEKSAELQRQLRESQAALEQEREYRDAERQARETAERDAAEMRERLGHEQHERRLAERARRATAEQLEARLEREREARDAAERLVTDGVARVTESTEQLEEERRERAADRARLEALARSIEARARRERIVAAGSLSPSDAC